jgi:predicted unusual protein kinase regulating ubiquinone biosynthesis (AarF/ABC1/UbiB family)
MSSTPFQSISRGAQYLGASFSAWRMSRASSDVNRLKAERHLAERLGRLRGLPQKMGQLMSMSSMGEEERSFDQLRGEAEPVELDLLLPILEDIWGRDLDSVFSHIEPRGLAASLGQVHQATLLDGREVAIKIQYPEIADSIETDLKALGWLSKPVGDLRSGFDMDDYRAVISDGLEEELDYGKEANNQELFGQLAGGLGYVIPKVVRDLSGCGVLTTEWQDGESLDQVVETWSEKDRSRVGRKLVEQFLQMGLKQGVLHGDPHPGNYRFRHNEGDPLVVLYDFGSICRLSARERDLLLCLITESVNPDSKVDPFDLFVELGFNAGLLEPLRHKLPAICRILFEPFGASGKYEFSYWQVSERLESTLGDDRLNFRISGPAKMVPFLRAFTGLAHAIKRLGVPVFWSGPFSKLVAERELTLESLELPKHGESRATFGGMAKHLRIRVTEDGADKVSLGMPATSVDRLHELLDDDLREKIVERQIDVGDLIRKVRENLYIPQEIFSLEDGGKCVTISLE